MTRFKQASGVGAENDNEPQVEIEGCVEKDKTGSLPNSSHVPLTHTLTHTHIPTGRTHSVS